MIFGFLESGDADGLSNKAAEYKFRYVSDRTYRSIYVLGIMDDCLSDVSKKFRESEGIFDSFANFFRYKKQYAFRNRCFNFLKNGLENEESFRGDVVWDALEFQFEAGKNIPCDVLEMVGNCVRKERARKV